MRMHPEYTMLECQTCQMTSCVCQVCHNSVGHSQLTHGSSSVGLYKHIESANQCCGGLHIYVWLLVVQRSRILNAVLLLTPHLPSQVRSSSLRIKYSHIRTVYMYNVYLRRYQASFKEKCFQIHKHILYIPLVYNWLARFLSFVQIYWGPVSQYYVLQFKAKRLYPLRWLLVHFLTHCDSIFSNDMMKWPDFWSWFDTQHYRPMVLIR